MDLELHQLELRYEALRRRDPRREKRLLASIAEVGQKTPVVVVAAERAGRYVLVDGYQRERCLRRLKADLVLATCWDLTEAEALLLERLLRSSDRDSALEQGWFLRELVTRFVLDLDDLGQRFGRSTSWVSRRLGLVRELPEEVQERVRQGAIGAHAAMKFLLPLARANRTACRQLTEAIAPLRLSSRQIGELYAVYQEGDTRTRELLLSDPALVLRARAEARLPRDATPRPLGVLLGELDTLGGIARRVDRRLAKGLAQTLRPPERQDVVRCFAGAHADVERLAKRVHKELADATDAADAVDDRPCHPNHDSQTP
jgi:ParB/RepB/Spo0J family partition protein